MADSYLAYQNPSVTDKKLDSESLTVGSNTVERERVQISGTGATHIAPVSATAGLKVDLGADNDVTVTSGTIDTITNVVHIDDNAGSITVDAASLPLPTGAATAAKQPALGTAGTASSDVITVQGIASMTALKVDGSAVTQPVSDAGGSLTVDYATTGSGTATGALRVELPTNGTGVIATVGAVTAITNALPAGTNAIGKLAANSGVDIGDVDVTSLVPGTTATSLGKAEDAAHSSGDTGVFALAVSNENSTAFGAASGDYTPIAVNRYGRVYTTTYPPSHASSNGTPISSTTTSVVAAPSAGNHLRVMRIHMSNGGSTATWVAVRDGAAGTQHYRTYLPQGGTMSLNLHGSGPLELTTATRLDIVLSAAGSVEYEIDYVTVAD